MFRQNKIVKDKPVFVLDFLVLFSICFFSGMVVAKNLHPNFDAKAMFLLAPASGLMSIFLLNAVLFTIGLWSFELVTFFVFLLIQHKQSQPLKKP